MFRGFARSELQMVAALLAILGAGWLLYQWRMAEPGTDAAIEGAAAHHPPGELVYTAGGGRGELERSRLAEGGRIDLNRATEEDLQLLPGIGPARSRDIVEHREQHGPFPTVEALREVHGIGPVTLERLHPYLEVEEGAVGSAVAGRQPGAQPDAAARTSGEPEPVFVNRADQDELQRLHGVGEAMSRRIVEERRARGPFRGPDDLQRVHGIGPRTVERNARMLRFD